MVTDLAPFIARRVQRRATITAAQVLLARDQLYAIDVLLHENLADARTEPSAFTAATTEALPPHAAYALETEISMLERLIEGMAVFAQSEPTARDYTAYVHHASRYLLHHDALLQLETALLGTCLVQSFYERTDALRAAAAQVPL